MVRPPGFEPGQVAVSSSGMGSHYPNHWIKAARTDVSMLSTINQI
jgi:hypothetical protein